LSVRSEFVRVALMGWLAGTAGYGLLMVLRGTGPVLSALGLALTAMSPLIYLVGSLRDRSGPATGHHPVTYSAVAGLGLAMTLALSWRFGAAAGQLHIWAGVTLLLWWAWLRLLRR